MELQSMQQAEEVGTAQEMPLEEVDFLPADPPSPAARKRSSARKGLDELGNFAFTLGPTLGFLFFGAIPLVLSIFMSFTEMLNVPDLSLAKFVGLQNYISIFKDVNINTGVKGVYSSAYKTTFALLLIVPLSLALGLYVAQLINKVTKGQKFFRSVFFIPYVCSAAVISLSFRMMYDYEFGVLNDILSAMGFAKYHWLNGTKWGFLMSTIIMCVWSGIGYTAVLFQAALANVDKTYYEAASVDGASDMVVFWRITFPAISPTTGYLLTMRIIGCLQIMTETHMLAGTDGGYGIPVWPGGWWVSDTIVTHMYNMINGWVSSYGYGIASACAWVLAAVIMLITQINFRLQRRWVCYDF